MTFNKPADNPQNRNVPIHSGLIVPKGELVHISVLSERISKKKIEELATQKYRACGQGIDFSDVMEFRCSKANAQRILKDCCGQRILFRSPKRTSPQRYYPSIIKADILENLKQKGNVPIQLTEVLSSKAPLSNIEEQKAQNHNKVYVTNVGSGTISVIDASRNKVTAKITVGKSPVGIAVNPTTNTIYVTNYASS